MKVNSVRSMKSSYVGGHHLCHATSVFTRERIGKYLQYFILVLLSVTIVTFLHPFYGVSKINMTLGGQGRSTSKSFKLPSESSVSTRNKVSLRYDWRNLDLKSKFAKEMSAHQKNCSLPLMYLQQRDEIGLGSDLHVWTQSLCNAMQLKTRLWTPTPWSAAGPNGTCDGGKAQSAMNCLFPKAELRCPQDLALTSDKRTRRNISKLPTGVGTPRTPDWKGCNKILSRGKYTKIDLQKAGLEYLFSHVTAKVIHEAERHLESMFPTGVPEDLITVHVRWGDKLIKEMKRISLKDYLLAIKKLLKTRPKGSPVNIFLATEDPQAVEQFRKRAKSRNWTVHVDPYVEEMKPYYRKGLNNNPLMTKELQGRPTISALASLLVSLEANYYVLTSRSNWSRMIDELRLAVIDPRCGNCTVMINLCLDHDCR
jgi:hypothetical protein